MEPSVFGVGSVFFLENPWKWVFDVIMKEISFGFVELDFYISPMNLDLSQTMKIVYHIRFLALIDSFLNLSVSIALQLSI